jgi:phosphoglycerate dehydrogenase-like enzyme
MEKFRVALSRDFLRADGTPAYPMFDLSPLTDDPRVEIAYVAPEDGMMRAVDLAEFDALILLMPRFTRASIPANGRLAVIARFGVGFDTVDVPALTEAGIALVTTPDGVRRPMAVAIITLMLALSTHLLAKDRITRGGPPSFGQRVDHMGMGLVGRTLGSIGIGNIGSELFRLAKPFDMRFICCDPYVDPAWPASLGVELVSIEEVFRQSDVVSINCPLSEETRGMVSARLLGLMKPTAFLINTARGPIVDQKALTEVLAARRIAGAGLDVQQAEPVAADDPILQLDNVVFSPHALGWTDQCFAGIGAADVAGVRAVMQGEVPRGLLNREVLERPAFRERLARYRGG